MTMSISTLLGFKPYRITGPDETLLLPADPGITIARRSLLAGSGGVLINATEGLAPPVVNARLGGTIPAASQAFPVPSGMGARHAYADENKTLIPVKTKVPSGTQVYLVKINGYADETTVTWTASTRTIVCTTGFAVNDYPNGALVYIYEGPGAGELNVVEDYVHSSLSLIMHRNFSATLTTSSKFIVLASASAANAVSPIFGRMDNQDVDEVEVDDGANDGDWCVYGDWYDIARNLKNGWLPVIESTAIY